MTQAEKEKHFTIGWALFLIMTNVWCLRVLDGSLLAIPMAWAIQLPASIELWRVWKNAP